MIGAVILGLALGAVFAVVGIGWRYWTGQPTVVTGGGWSVGPLQTGGWGILLGSIIALLEVLAGKRLADTWGVRVVLSAVGGMVGGLLAWRLYVALTAPVGGAATSPVPAVGQDANKLQGGG